MTKYRVTITGQKVVEVEARDSKGALAAAKHNFEYSDSYYDWEFINAEIKKKETNDAHTS